MDLVLAHGPAHRLCVVGAGNCNDLDLPALARSFREVHLVDIDETALQRAVENQRAPREAVQLHGGIDLTGVWDDLAAEDAGWSADRSVEQLAERLADGTQLGLQETFDVVLSAGVLTQLLESVAAFVGEDHPGLPDLVVAVRTGHIRTLLRAVRPGGRLVLASEVISSKEAPEIASASDAELPTLLSRALWTGDVLAGVNPAALVSWLIANRPERARLAPPGIVGPWRWHQTAGRFFLVVAFLIEKPG